MFDILFLLFFVLVALFSFVLLFGAPYVPTLTPQMKSALSLIDLKEEEHLLELGCGDGRVLLAAAKQGIHVTGYELNPLLAFIAWARTRRYRNLVTVVCGNFWSKKLPPAEAIFVFLLPKYMAKLDKKITQECSNSVKLVSFAFTIPGKQIAESKDGVHLYLYR